MANLPRFRGIVLQGSPTAGMIRGEMPPFMLAQRPFSQILALVGIRAFSGTNVAVWPPMAGEAPR
jgi:hypothetical protein